jgi:hypothetical protein
VRTTDVEVIEHSKKLGVKSYLVVPSTVCMLLTRVIVLTRRATDPLRWQRHRSVESVVHCVPGLSLGGARSEAGL